MQRITHVNFAKGFRGGERQTLLLIQALAQQGYKQTLLTRKGALLAEKSAGIENLHIMAISKPYFFSLLKIKGSDIIHAHEAKATHFAYFAKRILGIPYLLTRRIDQPIRKSFLNNKVYGHAKEVVALSLAIKAKIEIFQNALTVTVIPDAISELPIDTQASNALASRFLDTFLIAHIGELDNADKGQFYLIEAAKKLALTHPKIHFLLLGKGKDRETFEEQAKGLENITFEGYVDNIGDYVPHFDLFVFPSLREGMGSILLDMMHACVPIVASEVGGIPDIIHHDKNGLLIPCKESEALASAIIRMVEDKVLSSRLSSQAKEDAKAYTAKKMAERYGELYAKI